MIACVDEVEVELWHEELVLERGLDLLHGTGNRSVRDWSSDG